MKPSFYAFLGNVFEHYDLALYSLLTPFFASIFFSVENPVSALLLTLGIIPLGMLARPIGAITFGYIGDNYGRGEALFISLFGLGIVSGLLAFTPTYQQAGWISPFLMLFGRVLQNFFGIGETLGGAIFLLEQTEEKHHDLMSSLYGSSTIAGFLLASFGVSLLIYFDAIEFGWRYLYFFGFITAVLGAFLRKNIQVSQHSSKQNLKNVFLSYWEYRFKIFQIALVAGFSYATYSISLVFFNGFIPLVSSVSKEQMVTLNSFLLLYDFIALPFFGILAAKYSREKMMVVSALGIFLTGIPLFGLLKIGTLGSVILIRMIILTLGVSFAAPFFSWAQTLIPQAHRYSVISFSYALGSQLIGGPTAVISLWVFQYTSEAWTAALYWVGLAGATSLTLCLMQFPKNTIAFDLKKTVNNDNH